METRNGNLMYIELVAVGTGLAQAQP